MKRQLSDFASPATAMLGLFVQVLVLMVYALFVLETEMLSSAFISDQLRDSLVHLLGGSVRGLPDGTEVVVSLPGAFLASLLVSLLLNGLNWGANRLRSLGRRQELSHIVLLNALWTLPIFVWIGMWLSRSVSTSFAIFTAGVVNIVLAITLAGWGKVLLLPNEAVQIEVDTSPERKRRDWKFLLLAMSLFTVTFVWMNWALWYNVRIPHGDSVMYEEHLWNLTHGKGFRSYLDQGLFLGEHIQVIHVLLVPLHWLWPSHLLLELAETVALALGAVPTYLIARRRSGSSHVALLIACAYLLYFPVHYLDISIDLKTFRPISFGVPLMLWAINAMEQKHWKQMVTAFVLALACKEDYAIVIAPMGVWCIWNEWTNSRKRGTSIDRKTLAIGATTAVVSTAYLLFVVKLAIPWFRDGETVHYARYFEAFGETPTEIVLTMITNPQLLFMELVTVGAVIYFLRLIVPLGMPIRGWSQLLVGAPVFILLCLNNLAMQPPGPYHHFHAPLVPILVWAKCVVIGSAIESASAMNRRAVWIFSCAFSTSLLFSFSPLSIQFWDPGQEMYWRNQYVQDERARQFRKVLEKLPQSARIASTDYVHSYLTHYERSYDYSKYPRAVADYEDKVPDDTDYIVIDRRHKYSRGEYDDLDLIRELQREPEKWDLLPDETHGYFAILKRRKPAGE
ncbi:DUF2079 domain-containing protein [Thalassoglobus polymorphus]|nr:DUF2079 domain-containing protein [Thalassoglobus polymorphus]